MNLAHVLLEQARLRPDATVIIDVHRGRSRTTTFAELERSSARVAPRSVSRDAATSATTATLSAAVDSMQPVQVASPIVRNRTVASKTSSPSSTDTKGDTARSMPSRSNTSRRWAK